MKKLLLVILALIFGCNRDSIDAKPSSADSEALTSIAEKGPVRLMVRVQPKRPRLSDLVEMEIEVTSQPNVEVKPPTFGDAVGDFLVRDYRERTSDKSTKNDLNIRLFHYRLEPVSSGKHLIRSVAIEFIDNRDTSESRGKAAFIESEPIEIEITSEFGDQTPDLAKLDPMLPPVLTDRSWSWWWLAFALPLVALAVAWIVYRQKLRSPEPAVHQPTPEEIAEAALEQLLRENLPAAGLFKEFYVRLTGLVRCYIEGTTGLKAPEQTTEEFLREMRSTEVFSAERSAKLKEFLEAADMVKYAGMQPEAEQIELSVLRAKEFVLRQA
jgi:hypothetical protein